MRRLALAALAAVQLAADPSLAVALASSDAALDPFRKGRFQELEATLAALAAGDVRADTGQRMFDLVLERLADNVAADDSLIPRLEEWKSASTHSPYAQLAQARYQIELAWRARGGGFADRVEPDAWPEYEAHLAAAERALTRALEIAPDAREPRALRIRLALYQGLPKEEVARRTEQALAVDPVSPEAHDAMFQALMPRWGGTRERLLAFARESARRAPQDRYLALLVVRAHIDAGGGDVGTRSVYFHQPAVWPEASAAVATFLAADPDSIYGHNLLAYLARLSGEKAVLTREIARIGDDFDPRIWDAQAFEFTRDWARQTAPAAASKRAIPPDQAPSARRR